MMMKSYYNGEAVEIFGGLYSDQPTGRSDGWSEYKPPNIAWLLQEASPIPPVVCMLERNSSDGFRLLKGRDAYYRRSCLIQHFIQLRVLHGQQ